MERVITSYIGLVYLALLDRIKAAKIGVLHIDIWTQQTTKEEAVAPFNRPAVLIDFKILSPMRLGGGRYAVMAEIDLHVITDTKGTMNSSAPDKVISRGLQHLLLQDDLVKLLDGYNDAAKGIGSMSWLGTQTDSDQEIIQEYILTFKTRLVCDSATRQFTPVTPELILIPNIEEL